MKVVFLTAGAAGMYCGSCLHDNALAKALRGIDVDCVLQPLYTPIRTDAEDVSVHHVFFGGIHVYLLQQFPWLRWLPGRARRWLDWPPLIRWATSRAASTDAAKLGELSISMLRGTHGNQADEFRRLVDWMADEMKPDAVIFSNLLIGGGLPEIRKRLPQAKLVVLLQGDDIFLDHLPDDARKTAIELCSDLAKSLDLVCSHSRFYGEKMGDMLGIHEEKIAYTPLSIDVSPFSQTFNPERPERSEIRIGYLARIAPEKGFHRLVDAFLDLAGEERNGHVSLHAAGWLGPANEAYLDTQRQRLEQAGLGDRFEYHGSPDLDAKVKFLSDVDLFCVPTEYEDPKGLFVLESLAAGTPVVMPDHGAFGELIHSTGGGMLVPPNDRESLRDALVHLIHDPEKRRELAAQGHAAVHAKHSIETAAAQMRDLLF